MIHKSDGQLFQLKLDRSPYDVVAWYGSYCPFKYDMNHFDPINNAKIDHLDPSAHTVITSPSLQPGVAVFDFIAFVPRWHVAENTFRVVYPHRNCATEFNMVIQNGNDYFPVGSSYMSPFLSPHGIPERTIEKAITSPNAPEKSDNLWVMFESGFPFRETKWARDPENRIPEYPLRFKDIKKRFDPNQK